MSEELSGNTLPMIDLEAFVPDVMAECPAAPVPLIERRLRESITEACERANIVRWQAYELPTDTDKICYDVPVPNEHTQVHSIVRAYLNRCPIANIPPIETRDNVYNPLPNHSRGYFVPNRGQLQLTHFPAQNSDDFKPASAPVVPSVPVDPGPLATGFPANLPQNVPQVIVPVVSSSNANTSTLNVDLFDTIALGEVFTLDWTNVDLSAFAGTPLRNVTFIRDITFTQTGFYLTNEKLGHDLVIDNTGSAGSSGIFRVGDILAAQAAGTPFMNVLYRSATVTTGYKGVSEWAATADDELLCLTAPPTDAATLVTINASGPLSMPVNAGGFYETATLAQQTAVTPVVIALDLYDYVAIRVTGSLNRASTPLAYMRMVDPSNGDVYEYDIDWTHLPHEGVLAVESTASDFAFNTGVNGYVFWIRKLAVANGARGTMSNRGVRTVSTGNADGWVHTFEICPEVFSANEVTQADIDQYLLDLAAYNAALLAVDAFNNFTRSLFGLELYLTLKPTREADYVPKVLFDDYYNLIISGALSKLLKMHESPWQDLAYAEKKEIEFEHEIAPS